MRFEVNVDDGNNLDTLHKAREAYNAANVATDGFVPAEDMPSFVQRLMDKAASDCVEPFGPTTLSSALGRIAELEAANSALTKEIAVTDVRAAASVAQPN